MIVAYNLLVIILNKVKIGIPRALNYYYYEQFFSTFFKELDIEPVYSTDTTNNILKRGTLLANDEMCLSLKIYLGHIDYLKDKCDYILIPRIEDDGNRNQTCTNFLALYDIVNNMFDINILNYNISSKDKEIDGLIQIGKILNINKQKIIKAYKLAKRKTALYHKKEYQYQQEKMLLNQNNILLISHPYNTYDNLVGQPIIKLLKQYNLNIVYCDKFNKDLARLKALDISPNLYWKYSKENIGSLLLSTNIKGIVFLSTFPCSLDSLVNEYLMRKITKPYLNIIIDDIDSLTGIETRIESFCDIIGQN